MVAKEAIELYKQYLYNSTTSISNRDMADKLYFEKNKISEILNALDDLFYMDRSVKDKNDYSIYTYIKRKIIEEARRKEKDAVISESRCLLKDLLDQINIKQIELAA